jgi:hypothetical protein
MESIPARGILKGRDAEDKTEEKDAFQPTGEEIP